MSSAISITERLEFDTSSAEDAISKLDKSLGEATQSFKVNLADALDVLNGVQVALTPPDTAPITDAIDQAVQAADQEAVVTVEGKVDQESITGPIDEAVAAADTTVDVEADTTGAQDAIESLGATSTEAGGHVEGLRTSVEGFGVAAGAAEGSAKELLSFVGGLGEGAGVAAVGIGTLAAATTGLFTEAVAATSAEQRFNTLLGEQAESFKNIDVGGFQANLNELEIQLGSTSAEIENVASTLVQMSESAGSSSEQAQEFAQQILALSARAVSLNPTLGDLASVAQTMGTRIARGGRFVAQFGLSLSTAEINARALKDTGKDTASELEFVEKATAAAAIATERYGSSIQTAVEEGSQNAAIRLESLKARFQETIEELGKKVEAPVFTLLEDALPIGLEAADGISQIAASAIPLLTDAFHLAEPTIKLFAGALTLVAPVLDRLDDLLNLIPGPVATAALTFLALQKTLGTLGAVGGRALDLLVAKTGGFITVNAAAEVQAGLTGQAIADQAVIEEAAVAAAEADAVANEQLTLSFEAETAGLEVNTAATEANTIAKEAEVVANEEAAAALSVTNVVLAALVAAYLVYQEVVGHASQQEEQHKKALADLTTAFADNTRSVHDSADAFISAQGNVGEISAILNKAGTNFDQVTTAVLGSSESLDIFIQRLLAAQTGLSDIDKIILAKHLKDLGETAQDAAKATIETAEANSLLTEAEKASAFQTTRNLDGTVNYAAALEVLNPIIGKHKTAIDAQKTALAEAADAVSEAQKALDDYATAVDLTKTKTPQLVNAFGEVGKSGVDQIASMENLAIAISNAGLSTDELKVIAAGIGVSADQLDGFVKAVVQDIDTLTQAAVSKLPTISSVTDELIQTADQNRSQAESLNKQADEAAQKAAEASVAVEGETAKQAQARLKTVGEFNKTANDLRTQAASLQTSLNPADLVPELDKSIKTTEDFSSNLDFLVNSKFPELARLAAEKGPDFAAALVEKIQSDDTFAPALEDKLKEADQTMANFTRHFHDDLAPQIALQLGLIGVDVGKSFSDGIGEGAAQTDQLGLGKVLKDISKDANTAGSEAAAQFIAGFVSKDPAAAFAALGKAFGQEYVDEFFNALAISSPSRKAAEAGDLFVEGFALGLNRSGQQVIAEAELIAKSATDALQVSQGSLARALTPVPLAVAPTASPPALGLAPGAAAGATGADVKIDVTQNITGSDAVNIAEQSVRRLTNLSRSAIW